MVLAEIHVDGSTALEKIKEVKKIQELLLTTSQEVAIFHK